MFNILFVLQLSCIASEIHQTYGLAVEMSAWTFPNGNIINIIISLKRLNNLDGYWMEFMDRPPASVFFFAFSH